MSDERNTQHRQIGLPFNNKADVYKDTAPKSKIISFQKASNRRTKNINIKERNCLMNELIDYSRKIDW